LLTKEGIKKSAIAAYHKEKQATSRFTVGAVILSDPVLTVIRRELRRMSRAARIDKAPLAEIIKNEVLKRDVVESEKSAEATRRIKRSTGKPTIKTKRGGPAYR
ncbi:MAG: hypothetical protein RX318_11975, partial [bacterium]|nr:hypothetical protein [bacterium]